MAFLPNNIIRFRCNFVKAPIAKNINNSQVAIVDVAFNSGYGENKNTIFATLTFWGNDAKSILDTGYNRGHPFEIEGEITSLNPYITNGNKANATLRISVHMWRSEKKIEKLHTQEPKQIQESNSSNDSSNCTKSNDSNNQKPVNHSYQTNRRKTLTDNRRNQGPPTRNGRTFQQIGGMPYADESPVTSNELPF